MRGKISTYGIDLINTQALICMSDRCGNNSWLYKRQKLLKQLRHTKRYRVRKKIQNKIQKLQTDSINEALKNIYKNGYWNTVAVLKNLGVTAKKANGKTKSLKEVLKELKAK